MGHYDTPLQDLPPTIVQAIAQIQSQMTYAIEKTQTNKHGGYKFASTDDIYAALSLKMAAAGLVVIPLETREPEVQRVEANGKTSQWARFSFQFVLATAEATWTHKHCARSLWLQIMGPQTFQAAQSYAEKAFLRSIFKLATGDMDLDSVAPAETLEDAIKQGNGKRKSSSRAKKDGQGEECNELVQIIKRTDTEEELRQLRQRTYADVQEWPKTWTDLIEGEFDTRMEQLGGSWV